MTRDRFSRYMAWVGLLLGGATIAIQFCDTIIARMANGYSFGEAVIYFVSFLTILTNTGVVLTYASAVFETPRLDWFRHSATRAMFAVLILVVMVVYHLLLSDRVIPDLLSVVLDKILHYAAPILYLIWWVIHPRRGDAASYRQIPNMLIPPAIYLVWVFLRGAVVAEYPYPFLDLTQKTVGTVVTNLSVIIAGSCLFFALAVFIDKRLSR